MTFSDHNLIIVTPVYEDVDASGQLFKDIAKQFGQDVFVVAVDDGSIKQPLEISSLELAGVCGVVLRLRRNVGHQRAIAIGLGYVSERIQTPQRVVIMDSDGEDIPASTKDLLEYLKPDEVDVAVAQRKDRMESFRFKTFYAIHKLLFRLMAGRRLGFGNFMALKPHAVRRLVAMQELPMHVAACVLASRLRITNCPLDRGSRYAGQSKMKFVELVLHGFKALMVFAEDVFVRVGIACAAIAALSVLGAIVAVILKLVGFATPGWFSVALGILVLMFLQTGALTLMTLMLTGVVRGGTVTTAFTYRDFVEQIFETSFTTLPSAE